MSKTGFVFPGQGSQKAGMLSELYTTHEVMAQTFAEASEVLKQDLWEIIQNNPDGLLDQTQITQPALLTASVAIWRLWQAQGNPLPTLLAGHSLGEYSALVCAGVLDFADAVALVHKRGLYMQQAVPEGQGGMAAILGLENEQIALICQQVAEGEVVSAANFNAPGQTVIAGSRAAVDRATAACKEAGAKRALPLNVSVPSHCALMKPAAEQLAADMADISFSPASIPVIQNIHGRIGESAEEMKDNLLKQLYLPVQWVDSIIAMQAAGVSKVVECGPGKVLCGLIKRISPDITSAGSDDSQAFSQAAELANG